jgi:predicted nucleic acid-binding protein
VICVGDTSPSTNLAAVGQMELLQQLYGDVFVPEEVAEELVDCGPSSVGYVDVTQFAWLHVRPVANRPLVVSLLAELDIGEAAAIALATEREALLLIDERRGRHVAQRLGLRHVGLLGVLVVAKHRGLIPSVRSCLDGLVQMAGFGRPGALRACPPER